MGVVIVGRCHRQMERSGRLSVLSRINRRRHMAQAPVSYNQNPLQPASQNSSFTGFVLRLYWMLVGHIAIFSAALFIATQKDLRSILIYIFYFLLPATSVACRYLDIRFFKGQTSEGEPATMKHWRRFSIVVIIYSAAIWALLQVGIAFKII